MPGPLFAVTIEKSAVRKTAGALIALGHGLVEFPLMFLIYFGLNQVAVIPFEIEVGVGFVGGTMMFLMGVQTFRNRNKANKEVKKAAKESFLAGVWTTAANAGFILWWLTIGMALIMNAKSFGFINFTIFAGVHWLCDFVWYTFVAVLIFKSRRFWNDKVHKGITFFCVGVLLVFGALFFGSAMIQLINSI